jgi:hypothetical protein
MALTSLLIALLLAQTTVGQGAGNSQVTEWKESVAARPTGQTTTVCVGSSATPTPTTPLPDRKAIEIQNNGSAPIYCTIDGSTPVVATNGRWIGAGGAVSFTIGTNLPISYIAAAPQTAPNCTVVSEIGAGGVTRGLGAPGTYFAVAASPTRRIARRIRRWLHA